MESVHVGIIFVVSSLSVDGRSDFERLRLRFSEDVRVEQASEHASNRGSDPVHPVVGPGVASNDEGGAEGTGRVEGSAGVGDPEKMGADSSEADGQRDGSLEVGAPVVGGAEDGQDQHEGADHLHAKGLALCHLRVDVAHTHTVAVSFGGDGVEDAGSSDASKCLRHDVSQCPSNRHVASHQHAQGHGRVHVAS